MSTFNNLFGCCVVVETSCCYAGNKFWCNLYMKIMTLLTLSVKETMFIFSERGLKPNDSDINRSDGPKGL